MLNGTFDDTILVHVTGVFKMLNVNVTGVFKMSKSILGLNTILIHTKHYCRNPYPWELTSGVVTQGSSQNGTRRTQSILRKVKNPLSRKPRTRATFDPVTG